VGVVQAILFDILDLTFLLSIFTDAEIRKTLSSFVRVTWRLYEGILNSELNAENGSWKVGQARLILMKKVPDS